MACGVGSTLGERDGKGEELDAFLYAAEAGSARSLLYPAYTVAIPQPGVLKGPVAYQLPRGDRELVDFINIWVELKKRDGTIAALYDYWVLGKNAVPRQPRWSVIRNVLHWCSERREHSGWQWSCWRRAMRRMDKVFGVLLFGAVVIGMTVWVVGDLYYAPLPRRRRTLLNFGLMWGPWGCGGIRSPPRTATIGRPMWPCSPMRPWMMTVSPYTTSTTSRTAQPRILARSITIRRSSCSAWQPST